MSLSQCEKEYISIAQVGRAMYAQNDGYLVKPLKPIHTIHTIHTIHLSGKSSLKLMRLQIVVVVVVVIIVVVVVVYILTMNFIHQMLEALMATHAHTHTHRASGPFYVVPRTSDGTTLSHSLAPLSLSIPQPFSWFPPLYLSLFETQISRAAHTLHYIDES